jgi:preprotein translocase subunit YajC
MGPVQIGGLILIFVVMYLLMIRPQRKRQKQLDELRNNIVVGDRITTIGGIKGTVAKVGDDEVTIHVGADRVKLDIRRWAVSTVDDPAADKEAKVAKAAEDKEKKAAEEAAAAPAAEDKPARKPRRLGEKKDDASGETDEATDKAEE